MKKCKITDCDRQTFEDNDTCILHCIKGDYQDDKNKDILNLFNNELVKYIVENIKESVFPSLFKGSSYENNIEQFLKGFPPTNSSEISNLLSNRTIIFKQIIFPARDERDTYDYEKTLKKIGSIHFDTCEFYSYNLNLVTSNIFFQDCIFNTNWFLFNYKILENANNVIYQNCKFLCDVNSVAEDYTSPVLENDMFCDCEFKGQLSFDKLLIKGKIFKNHSSNKKIAKDISISKCTIESPLIINNFGIKVLNFEYSNINSKFELKNNNIISLYFFDTNFSNLFNSAETNFDKFQIEKSIFNDYVGFQNCKFGKSDEKIAIFKYVTFQSFVDFRNAKFYSGLDIQNCNFKDPPNFLNAFVAYPKTNRETFRIIKYSFDRVGNYIAANDFYELEIKKYKDEIKANKSNYSSRILLNMYGFTSNFGQSFIRPLMLIIFTSILYWFVVYGFENNTIYLIFPKANNVISFIAESLNVIAKGLLPFRNILKEGMEFISLIFYIIYTILIWLIILAIKRKTKR